MNPEETEKILISNKCLNNIIIEKTGTRTVAAAAAFDKFCAPRSTPLVPSEFGRDQDHVPQVKESVQHPFPRQPITSTLHDAQPLVSALHVVSDYS